VRRRRWCNSPEHLETGIDETLLITIHGAHLTGPWVLDDQVAGTRTLYFLALPPILCTRRLKCCHHYNRLSKTSMA